MASYVYGIVQDASEAPAAQGIAGAAVQVVQGSGAGALVSELPTGEQVELGRQELLVHARVLEEALGHGTVLPMRFGIVLEDPEAVRHQLLEAHAEHLRGQLDDLNGKVEMRVRATYEEKQLMREVVEENRDIQRLREEIRGKPEDATYFKRIGLGEMVAAALERKREDDGRVIVDAIAPHASAVELEEPAHERVALTGSFLIERQSRERFEAAVEKVAEAQAGRMQIKLTGPLPPHSFVYFDGSG